MQYVVPDPELGETTVEVCIICHEEIPSYNSWYCRHDRRSGGAR